MYFYNKYTWGICLFVFQQDVHLERSYEKYTSKIVCFAGAVVVYHLASSGGETSNILLALHWKNSNTIDNIFHLNQRTSATR